MKSQALVALLTLAATVNALDARQNHARAAKRATSSASGASSSSGSSSVSSAASSASGAPGGAPSGTAIPSLSLITSGMPSPTTLPVTATFSAGASVPVSGAPPLPTPFVFQQSQWPPQDQVAPTDGAEVAEWMKELEGFNVPNITPTQGGECATDPQAAAQAESRGWWTCGGYTRDTDIVACPDKMTWGVSFDDGPAPYTQQLLQFLASKNITSTFFVVGSRVIERPQVLVEEYMAGHEIAVHTWSHRPLTSLTTQQVVAELGYTRKAIRQVLGVSPTLMRPPFGDIDDRVRAISLAMGMVPVIWSRTPSGATFDTNDWKVPGGVVTGPQSFSTFQSILQNATQLDTGFIVLEHDLYPQTVDLAIGYTLPAALSFNPKITMDSIGHCNGIPASNLYAESNTNGSFPYANSTMASNKTSGSSNGGHSAASVSASLPISAGIAAALVMIGSMLM
ncbi:carbohydrate esterase family 4 protein [Coniophora puteana RWD-64-598 SS2]|uniref:chitin deacetylase n=1 Tax=Coniophora puteana (strain RWD-64-598) TaxID=741705 RepID=A0A5M3MK53_CONPW|nr:carbohydrate esterase family 4 protein [Coniophora puteana RWD-64-598 SS2]EIW79320.1 carbohydrate esterase family 4 protein [Coniophora puteana RWD-64-598 SS2]